MVRRVCRELGNKKNIVVLNDEAHHCYQAPAPKERRARRSTPTSETRRGEDATRRPASGSAGCEAVQRQARRPGGLRPLGHAVLPRAARATRRARCSRGSCRDFSADRRHRVGHREGPAGARRRRLDGRATLPMYRDLWLRIRDELPQKGLQGRRPSTASRACPKELEGALLQPVRQLREVVRRAGSEREGRRARRRCSSWSARTPHLQARLRLDRWLGEDRCADGSTVVVPGNLPLFSNEEDGALARPPEHAPHRLGAARLGRGDDAEFKKIAAAEIDEFKDEYRAALPGPQRRRAHRRGPPARGHEHRRQAGPARRADPLRRLGLDAHRGLGREHRHPHPRRPRVRDAAALRAGRRPRPAPRQLRAERRGHVRARVRRGLRRPVQLHPDGRARPKPGRRSRSTASGRCPSGRTCEISFPRSSATATRCRPSASTADFDAGLARSTLSTDEVPTRTELDPIVGESKSTTLDDLKDVPAPAGRVRAREARRSRTTSATTEQRPTARGCSRSSLRDRRALAATSASSLKDGAFPQMLLLTQYSHAAAEKIYQRDRARHRGREAAVADPAPVRRRSARRATSTSTPRRPSTTTAERAT